MSHYIIIPFCMDTNRGDQALVWETERIAREHGYSGRYFAMGKKSELFQTEARNMEHISPVLEHPSRVYKSCKNINYDLKLKLKWGLIAGFDLISSLLYINPVVKHIARVFASAEKKKSMKTIANAGAVFVKGGGFIHSYGGLHGTYTVYYSLYHIMFALSEKKDVYVMPNSYGPFEGPFVKRLVNKILKKCKLVTARESISHKMLYEQCGVDNRLLPDLAIGLESMSSELADGLIKDIPFGKKKCVAITVRPYRFPGAADSHKAYGNYKNAFVKFIGWLSENGYYPVLVEHVYSEQEHENDASAIRDIVSMLPDSVCCPVISNKSLDCMNLKYIYSKFDYIVGTRFHSVLFSITAKALPVAITYGGNKGRGTMRDMGAEELCIPIEQLSLESLKKTFGVLLSDEEGYRNKIRRYVEEMTNELLRIWE